MQKNEKNKSGKIPKNSVSLRIVESALSSPDGNVSGVLRGEMPRFARAEDKDKAKKGWELIYKRRSTLKGKQSPKTVARTPGTPLPGHSLTHFSLLHVPPPQMRPSRSHPPSKTSPR